MSTRNRERQAQHRRHKAWPLGTRVAVTLLTGDIVQGSIHRHERKRTAACDVAFDRVVNGLLVPGPLCSGNCERYSHPVYFQALHRLPT
jgi:hypothetical protein